MPFRHEWQGEFSWPNLSAKPSATVINDAAAFDDASSLINSFATVFEISFLRLPQRSGFLLCRIPACEAVQIRRVLFLACPSVVGFFLMHPDVKSDEPERPRQRVDHRH